MALRTGKTILYAWHTDRGDIYTDFHGHDPEAGDEYWVRSLSKKITFGLPE